MSHEFHVSKCKWPFPYKEVMSFKTLFKVRNLNYYLRLLPHSFYISSLFKKTRIKHIRDTMPASYIYTHTHTHARARGQSRVVGALRTGNNTMRRHLYTMGLTDIPVRRRCEEEEEISVRVLCECEALTTLRHTYQC